MATDLGAVLRQLPRPMAVVFSGGGARTPAQVGMMAVLSEHGLQPDLMVSSSFASINAAAYAAAARSEAPAVTEKLTNLWRKIGDDSAFASPGATLVRRLTVSRGKRTTKAMRELVREVVPDLPLDELPTQLLPIASNLVTGLANEIVAGSTLDAVLASSAVPIMLNPITLDDDILFDGAFTETVPLRPALNAGARSIICLDVGSSMIAEDELQDLRWWQVGTIAYNHLLRGQLGPDLVYAGDRVPVLTITTNAGNQFDFSQSADQIAAGRSAAQRALTAVQHTLEPGLYGIPDGFETYQPFAALQRATVSAPESIVEEQSP